MVASALLEDRAGTWGWLREQAPAGLQAAHTKRQRQKHDFNTMRKDPPMTDGISPSLSTQSGVPSPDWGKRDKEGLLGEVISNLSLLK